MRIYQNFNECFSEIKRDLKEMGIKVHTQTYQNKFIGDDESMATFELQNYIYTVVDPDYSTIPATQPWANNEWWERAGGRALNPGSAWELRKEVWSEFLNERGQFDYTYSERLQGQIKRIINGLTEDPASRQMFISVWTPDDLRQAGGVKRIPCTLGYYFQIRDNQLNITYLQRSADFATHFMNDVYLAGRMHSHLVWELREVQGLKDLQAGNFTHWVGSLHVFQKDVKGVF